jgi:SAM-dependent methyltransferase
MTGDYRFRDTCRLCDSRRLDRVLELTPTPPGNRVLTEAELAEPAPSYPLELYLCAECHHVQLGHVVDPRILYRNQYSYVTGTSPVFVDHLRRYARDMVERWGLPPGALVADIGSNDGTCLSFFQDAGMTVLGIDPATEIAARATANGVPTVAEFFSADVARRLRAEHGPAHFITSHNACAHIDDLGGIIDGVAQWLADDGVFVMEVGYFVDVYQNGWFDTIYHEHLDYHTVSPLIGFFRRRGMEVVSVARIAPQGGSIRVMAQKAAGPHAVDGTAAALAALEVELGVGDATRLRGFGDRLATIKRQLGDLLAGIKQQGKRVAGYGAPTKSTTLMMHFGLGKELIDFIVDDNPLKQGHYTPATHVPIGGPDWIYERRPEYLLVLAWNFAESIMKKHGRYQAEGGRFVLPMPEPRIIAPEGAT